MIKITQPIESLKEIGKKLKVQFDLFNDGYLFYAKRKNEKLLGGSRISESVLTNKYASLFVKFDISHLIPGILKF